MISTASFSAVNSNVTYGAMLTGVSTIVVYYRPERPEATKILELKRQRTPSLSDPTILIKDLQNEAKVAAAKRLNVHVDSLQAEIVKRTDCENIVSPDSVSHVDITNVAGQRGTCLGCLDLQARLDKNHTDALLRQAALNIEYMIKMEVYALLPDDLQSAYRMAGPKRRQNFAAINATSVDDFLEDLPVECLPALLVAIHEESLETLDKLLAITKRLRKSFVASAHPTEMSDGSEADLVKLTSAVQALRLGPTLEKEDIFILNWLDNRRSSDEALLCSNS